MNNRRIHPTKLHRQAGISNIQIMIGVLISAILILGGMGLLRQIDKAKVNNDLNELTELKAHTVSYASQHGGTFAGVTQETLIGLDFFPANRVTGAVGSRVVQNQWKGTIVTGVDTTSAPNDSLNFVYSGVSSSACKELGLQATSLASLIAISSAVVKPVGGVLDEAALIAACNAANDNASVGYRMSR